MAIFLVLAIAYLGSWGVMFRSETFRWTWVQWTFFGTVSTTSVLLTLTSFLLGLICRVNFGKGLPRYRELDSLHQHGIILILISILVNAQDSLDEEDGVKHGEGWDEKVDFPSDAKPTPTFAVAFPAGVDRPAQLSYDRQPFGSREYSPAVQAPPVARVVDAANTTLALSRQDSITSERSVESAASSQNSYSSKSRAKRWIIE
jgi:hypothetical protein